MMNFGVCQGRINPAVRHIISTRPDFAEVRRSLTRLRRVRSHPQSEAVIAGLDAREWLRQSVQGHPT